jgi:hypothetical protein
MTDIETANVTPTGTWDYTGGAIYVAAPTEASNAATKKYVDDNIAGGSVSDEAYGIAWDGVTDTAPSKNAVYDKIETLAGGHDAVTIVDSATIDLDLDGQQISGAVIQAALDHTQIQNIGTTTHADIDIAVAEYAITSGAYAITSGAYAITSAAYLLSATSLANLTTLYDSTSAAYAITSGAYAITSAAYALSATSLALVTAEYDITSAAYLNHAGDSSDPHGAILTQTHLDSSGIASFSVVRATTASASAVRIVADSTASGAEVVRNILIGTEASSALTASNYYQGTIYLKYSA